MERVRNVRNAPTDKAVEVLVGKFVTLVEQAFLQLSQASLSVTPRKTIFSFSKCSEKVVFPKKSH